MFLFNRKNKKRNTFAKRKEDLNCLSYELGIMMYRASNEDIYNRTYYDVNNNFENIIINLGTHLNLTKIKEGFIAESNNDIKRDRKKIDKIFQETYNKYFNY